MRRRFLDRHDPIGAFFATVLDSRASPLAPPRSEPTFGSGRDACVIVLDGDRGNVENFLGDDSGVGALDVLSACALVSSHFSTLLRARANGNRRAL